MSTTPPNTPGDPAPPPGPGPGDPGHQGPRVTREEVRDLARLRRSRTDKKVAGVAGGLARHLDVDPLLLRVAFVILCFFGGGGLILYGVIWLIVPEEETEQAVVRVEDNVRSVALVVTGAIAAVAVLGDSFGGPGFPWPLWVVGVALAAFFLGKDALKPGTPHPWLRGAAAGAAAPSPSPGPSQPGYPSYRPGPQQARPVSPRRRGPLLFFFTAALAALGLGVVATLQLAGLAVPPSAYPATVLATCGVMLVVGAFYGRGGGLILIGLLAAALTAITTATGAIQMGQIDRHPDRASDLASSYDLGAGAIRIDLTDLDDPENLPRLDLEVGLGRIEVIVPEEGLSVEVDAVMEGGSIDLFGERSSASDRGSHDGGPGAPVLTIDAELFLGEITVQTEGARR